MRSDSQVLSMLVYAGHVSVSKVHVLQKTLTEDMDAWWSSSQPDSTRGVMYPPPSPLELQNLSILHKDLFNGNSYVALWSRWAWLSHNKPRWPTPQTPYGTYHRGTLWKLLNVDFYIRSQYFNLLRKYFSGISKVNYPSQNSNISSTRCKGFCAKSKLHLLNIFEENNAVVFVMISR